MLRRIFGTHSSTRTATAPYSASNPPTYVYKIVPTAKSNPRYLFPIPIPASHEFVLSELDAKDGFIHMSTAPQIHGVLSRFFAKEESVMLLKIDFARLSGFKVVKWEGGSEEDGRYPHLYRTLEGEYVESVEELEKGEDGEKAWHDALEKLEQKGWLV
ncbi:uncharacterized protein JCM15063_006346 [Sporobolomyces koalae]|uniref:uncharacterized protein n=1 Tax=Sporobolomyces koalae TaxID=500713 RepID=UPI0031763A01